MFLNMSGIYLIRRLVKDDATLTECNGQIPLFLIRSTR